MYRGRGQEEELVWVYLYMDRGQGGREDERRRKEAMDEEVGILVWLLGLLG